MGETPPSLEGREQRLKKRESSGISGALLLWEMCFSHIYKETDVNITEKEGGKIMSE